VSGKRNLILCGAIVAAAAAVGALMLSTRPAPAHAYFASERPGVQVIAHRGGAQLRPENTLAAFAYAAEIGADILETDVRATADGAIVCLHDATVERTTDGKGRVDAMTLAELSKLDAGYRWTADGGRTFPFRGRGIAVPELEAVLARFPGKRMVIEIKPPEVDFARSLCALIRRSGARRSMLVASFSAASLSAFRAACPEVATSMHGREARLFAGLSRAGLAALYSPAAAALQIPDRLGETVIPRTGLLEDARGRNLKVHVWTVNDEVRMRELVALGVDGIMTDRPDLLLGLRGRAPR
jgi:glycerophosphoryl diester phosphodiesterase